jgi:AhpD family alkylhydroperoxidase
MSQRLDYYKQSPELSKKLFELSGAVKKGSLGNTLLDLVNIRASQLNGCALCLDMHCKEAKIHGERELRLYHIPIWRESPLSQSLKRLRLNGRKLSPRSLSMAFLMKSMIAFAPGSAKRNSRN